MQDNFIRCSKVSAAGRPEWVKCYLNEMEPSSQVKPESYEDGSFKELLNHAAPPNTAFSPLPTSAAETYPCDVEPPTLEEVCTAIRQLRKNKAPGEDGIPSWIVRLVSY